MHVGGVWSLSMYVSQSLRFTLLHMYNKLASLEEKTNGMLWVHANQLINPTLCVRAPFCSRGAARARPLALF